MSIDPTGGHPAMDYSEHTRTYGKVLSFTRIAIVFLICLLSAMYFFLV